MRIVLHIIYNINHYRLQMEDNRVLMTDER